MRTWLRRPLAAAALVLASAAGPASAGQSGAGPETGASRLRPPPDRPSGAPRRSAAQTAGLRFVVTLDPGLPAQPRGRLLVVLAPAGRTAGEPRFLVGRTGPGAAPTLGVDAPPLAPGDRVTVGDAAAAFPFRSLRDLPAGAYRAQAVLTTNRDVRRVDAAGNLYGDVRRVDLDPARPAAVHLRLTRRIPDERRPDDAGFLRFVEIRSPRLSAFHGRPMRLRAGVVLPPGHGDDPARRYPLRVRIGGYGARHTEVRRLMRPGSPFRAAWLDPDAPRFVLVHLDGAGPWGDPYQVNSANNGPWGDAVTEELIPHVEARFRAGGSAGARVLDGESTGGWAALALQIFHPDFFGGAWASCPDSVDFRAFQLVDVYGDANAWVDSAGRERPAARNLDGSVRFTMRHELRMENVLGAGDDWTRSGGQWGAWNAVYGPRGADGLPVPLWDPVSGAIDPAAAAHWERYDLRLVLERGWDTLAPKLRGRLNIWVGEMDDYFLEGAVRRLDAFLQDRGTGRGAPGAPGRGAEPSAGRRPGAPAGRETAPPAGRLPGAPAGRETAPAGGADGTRAPASIEARIVYGPGRGHCWTGISPAAMLREMAAQVARAGRREPGS